MRYALIAGCLVLVVATTAGCGGEGGGDGGAASPSKEDFCKTWDQIEQDFEDLGSSPKDADYVKALQRAADAQEETGTPENITDEARKGSEVMIKTFQSIDADATKEDVAQVQETLGGDEQKYLDAFSAYVTATCADGVAQISPCLTEEHGLFVQTFEASGDETGNLSVAPDPDFLTAVISVVSFRTSEAKELWVESAPMRNASALSVGDDTAVSWTGTPLATPEMQSVIDAVKDCLPEP